MSTTQPSRTPSQSRPGRILTAASVLAFSSLLLVGALLSAIPQSLNHFTDLWNGFADLSTAALPFGQDPTMPDSERSASYAGVLLTSSESLFLPRTLQLTHTVITFLVVISGSLATSLLAIRLMRRRSFARHLRWSLIALGLLVVVLATAGPQLDAAAVDAATRALGYPVLQETSPEVLTPMTPDSIVLNLWDPVSVVGRFDIILLVIGGLVTMFGVLVSDGERMQRDTEGLI